MIGILQEKLGQLLDTLIEPIWRKVLALSWWGRLLVLLAGICTVFVFYDWDRTKTWIGNGQSLLIIARGDLGIPLPNSVIDPVKGTKERLAASLTSEIEKLRRPRRHSWQLMQAVVAGNSIIPIKSKSIRDFVRSESHPDCSCWSEVPDTHPPCIPASSWVIFGLAEINEPATKDEIKFLLDEQHPDGWWAVFQVDPNDPQYASTYGTAWALLALHNQISKKLIPKADRPTIESAINRGAAWLSTKREPGAARWKDYPISPTGTVSESLSALAVHALHKVLPEDQLETIEREWLQNLPAQPPKADESDNPYHWITIRADPEPRKAQDVFLQIKLPWMLIATVDAYPAGSSIERALALNWLKTALADPSVLEADTIGRSWWRSEMLHGLRYVLRSTSSSTAKPTK